ncbi:MAG TPA: acireductone dioxygenase, partial [Brevibacillus sp.]|nr:acireductone dioxygenase [Brevibacillus sp.]
MAQVRFHDTNEYIKGATEVNEFLSTQGIIYEHWGVDRLAPNLRDNYSPTEEEKQQILDAFKPEIEDISKRRGYLTA